MKRKRRRRRRRWRRLNAHSRTGSSKGSSNMKLEKVPTTLLVSRRIKSCWPCREERVEREAGFLHEVGVDRALHAADRRRHGRLLHSRLGSWRCHALHAGAYTQSLFSSK